MPNLEMAWRQIRRLDEIAAGKTVIHQLDPRVKLIVTFFYIVTVVSYHKYDLLGLLPLVLYPVFLIVLAELPLKYLLERLLVATPFVFFVGVFNPIFDHTPILNLNGLIITGGWFSFNVLLVKCGLTILAALILVAVSGINEMGTALLKLKIPRVLVMQLLFMYRYLSVLMEETGRSLRAYQLRNFEGRGIDCRAWGSLVGHLLLRTIDRAQRIYHAMLCRGFQGELRFSGRKKAEIGDWVYLISWTFFFILVRWVNIPVWLGSLFREAG